MPPKLRIQKLCISTLWMWMGKMEEMAMGKTMAKTHDRLENISESGRESSDSNNRSAVESRERDTSALESDNASVTKPSPSERSENDSEEYNLSNDLEEGRLVNQNGKLTIEVEVKEMGSSEDTNSTPDPLSATLESNLTPVLAEDSGTYDSYRVYSEQNLLTPTTDQPPQDAASYSRRSSRTDMSRNDAVRLNRAKQARGVYLRRMEHRNSQSNISRTQSNERGLESVNTRVGGGGSPLGGMEAMQEVCLKTGRAAERSWRSGALQQHLLEILEKQHGIIPMTSTTGCGKGEKFRDNGGRIVPNAQLLLNNNSSYTQNNVKDISEKQKFLENDIGIPSRL
ncbi:uncharacterized protein CEXT_120201 [Caerostris extrusa]|uniref:Uncharacterized protein n=1 Tax=Caerostris extrusa TaxID=172846 RepID=A0AAV4XIE5_CAEEX|nr:uncharacterized protein CEXT_120201 [Caerostris extrusa]